MELNERLVPAKVIELIQKYGKCELDAYPVSQDSKPVVYKIGWGSTIMPNGEIVQEGDSFASELEADEALALELQSKYLPALSTIPHWLEMTDNQRTALFSFAWSTALYFWENEEDYPGFAYNFRVRNNEAIATLIAKRNEVNGSKRLSLVHRRHAEVTLWNKKGANSQRSTVALSTTLQNEQSFLSLSVVFKGQSFLLTGLCSPVFKGGRVTIKLNGKCVTQKVIIDPDGSWEYAMSIYEEGVHTLKIWSGHTPQSITVVCLAADALPVSIRRIVTPLFEQTNAIRGVTLEDIQLAEQEERTKKKRSRKKPEES